MERQPPHWAPRSIKWPCQTTATELNTPLIKQVLLRVKCLLSIPQGNLAFLLCLPMSCIMNKKYSLSQNRVKMCFCFIYTRWNNLMVWSVSPSLIKTIPLLLILLGVLQVVNGGHLHTTFTINSDQSGKCFYCFRKYIGTLQKGIEKLIHVCFLCNLCIKELHLS